MEKILQLIMVSQVMWIIQGQMEPQCNIIVAKDGSGNFSQISEAVTAAPNNSAHKFCIKIKAGTYIEHLQIGIDKENLVFIGDGMDSTIVTNNRSNRSGYNTIDSSTVDIYGNGFIAWGISFINSAGAESGQAVALKSSSNYSAFYNCRIQGFQDTLYVDKGIQFYRDSEIFGTEDFIFGNAAVVFQNCKIFARNPVKGSACVITAQSKGDASNHTGMVMHNCSIGAAADYPPSSGTTTFLGRPWRSLATVVIMQSYLGNLVDPQGWIPWDNNATSLDNVYYKEYQNRGPGADTSQRAVRVMNPGDALKFTVRSFIQGDTWIPQTNIPFNLDLF